jgi:hypothetical protein
MRPTVVAPMQQNDRDRATAGQCRRKNAVNANLSAVSDSTGSRLRTRFRQSVKSYLSSRNHVGNLHSRRPLGELGSYYGRNLPGRLRARIGHLFYALAHRI